MTSGPTSAGWIEAGRLRLAVALDTVEYGPTLLTHAGLTRQKWVAIGRPEDPAVVAATLNREFANDPPLAFAAGEMLGVKPRLPVGVAWASARELLQSWDMEPLPFSQVHGHASPRRWSTGTWAPGLPRRITGRASADPERRHSRFLWPDGGQIVCVDPDYGTDAAPVPLDPLMLTGEILGGEVRGGRNPRRPDCLTPSLLDGLFHPGPVVGIGRPEVDRWPVR